jgi:hypothetical protein
MTLGGAPSGNSNGNRRQSLDVANAPGGHREAPGSTSKPRIPKGGRKSMMPRVGRKPGYRRILLPVSVGVVRCSTRPRVVVAV